MRVSVLVPVLNEAEHLAEALAAMQRQVVCGEVELLVIDGGSSDSTQEIAAEIAAHDSRVRLLVNPQKRTPNALNIGLVAARGRFIARMDAHSVYPQSYLADGVSRLEAGGVDWVSGPQLPLGRGRWSHRVALALRSPLGVGGASFRTLPLEEIEVDSGFTGVWRRDRLLQLDGWDEGWPVNQDGELAARIRATGGRIVCVPAMAASYVPRDSLRALRRQYWRYGQYKAKTCRRHPTSMRRSHLLAPGLILTFPVALRRGRLSSVARVATLLYGAALAAAGLRAGRDTSVGDRLGVSAALATMHIAWGAGFFAGCARYGVPIEALKRVARKPSV